MLSIDSTKDTPERKGKRELLKLFESFSPEEMKSTMEKLRVIQGALK
jgi:hypothetical protein